MYPSAQSRGRVLGSTRRNSEGFHSLSCTGMGHVAALGKLSKIFSGREDGKDIPQEEGVACVKLGSLNNDLSVQGNS